jgi:Amt family ammonium transporter
VAGLATITPAAAFVSTSSAAIIGITAGLVCYMAIELKNKMRWDDALDVWGVHGVGGALGILMLGVLGSTAINAAGSDGLVFGGTGFFGIQLAAVIGSSIYAFVFTWIMLWLIDRITPVKTTEAEEGTLDESLHGETAYE